MHQTQASEMIKNLIGVLLNCTKTIILMIITAKNIGKMQYPKIETDCQKDI